MGAGYQPLGGGATTYEIEDTKERLEARIEEMLGGRPKSLENTWWTGWQAQAEDAIGSLRATSENDAQMLASLVSRGDETSQELDHIISGKEKMTELADGIGALSGSLEALIEKFTSDFKQLETAADQVWSLIQRISENEDAQEASIELNRLENSSEWETLMETIRREESEELQAWQSAVRETVEVGHEALKSLRQADLSEIDEIETSPGVLDELDNLQRGPVHPEQEHQKELQSVLQN